MKEVIKKHSGTLMLIGLGIIILIHYYINN
jgi:hypothetical protein